MALATLFADLGMLYCWIMHEYNGVSTIFIALSTCLNLVLSGLFWQGREQAKGIL
jgi:type IV secretory pathway VirB3-like protein